MKLRTESKFILLAGLAVVAMAGVRWLGPRPSSAAWTQDYQAALSQAAQEHRRVLLVFTTESCPACRSMESVYRDATVSRAMAAFIPVRVDAWRERALANRFGVTGVPAFVVVDSTGRTIARSVGYEPAETFLKFLTRASR